MPAANKVIAVVASHLDADFRQACQLARQIGCAAVQLDAASAALDVTALSGSGRREVRQILSSHALQLASLRIDLGRQGLGPGADVDAVLHQMRQVMEAASGLGTAIVCVEVGPLPPALKSSAPAPPPIPPELAGLILIPPMAKPAPSVTNLHEIPRQVDPTFTASVDGALAELGGLADRIGVTLAIRSELSDFAAIERALRTAACPWFGVDLDPVSLFSDVWTMPETLNRLAGTIRHVRVRDGLRGTQGRVKPTAIGSGDVNWRQLLALLDEARFAAPLAIDCGESPDRVSAATAAVAYLRRVVGQDIAR